MFYEQLKKLCKQRNTTPTAFVTEKLGLSSSKITAWKNGSIPKYGILKKISEHFNVPISYLFMEDDDNNISEEQRLVTAFRQLSNEGRDKVLEIAEMYAKNPQYQKYTDISENA